MKGGQYEGHIRLKWGRLTLSFRLDDLVVEVVQARRVAHTMRRREVVDDESRRRWNRAFC